MSAARYCRCIRLPLSMVSISERKKTMKRSNAPLNVKLIEGEIEDDAFEDALCHVVAHGLEMSSPAK